MITEGGSKVDSCSFIDFSSWPTEFATSKEALDCYNTLGIPHKIMFKVIEPHI